MGYDPKATSHVGFWLHRRSGGWISQDIHPLLFPGLGGEPYNLA